MFIVMRTPKALITITGTYTEKQKQKIIKQRQQQKYHVDQREAY